MKLKQLRTVFQEVARGNPNLGDIAILKADALGARAHPDAIAKLQPVVGYHPPVDLDALMALPEGSFGYEYAHHMRRNKLQPFNVSPGMAALAQENVFALRYAVTHDIFHVLLGFDTSYAGEMGVLAFAVAQDYSRLQRVGLWMATVLYPVLAPGQMRQIARNRRRGYALGKQAKFLLGYRFEEMWERSLHEVRQELNLLD
ncbi:MAG: Coq4 family protein [Cyanobacteria bacterium P01_A01_bin.135]